MVKAAILIGGIVYQRENAFFCAAVFVDVGIDPVEETYTAIAVDIFFGSKQLPENAVVFGHSEDFLASVNWPEDVFGHCAAVSPV